MKKSTKKLISLISAGLILLQSIPFLAVGSFAAGNEALKYTPSMDGVKDAAYDKSYNHTMPTSYGSVDFSFLYDDSYIYVYADVSSTEKGIWDLFGLAISAAGAGWADLNGSYAYLVSNPFYDGFDLRHYGTKDGSFSGYQNMGYNIGFSGGEATGSEEYELVRNDTGAIVEFRIAYNKDYEYQGSVSKTIYYAVDYQETGDPTGADAGLLNQTNYNTFTLGRDYYEVAKAIKTTPIIDGTKDAVYDSSYSYSSEANGLSNVTSFLYDDNYIYVYAKLDWTGEGNGVYDMSIMGGTDSPSGNWDATSISCNIASNPFISGHEIRHWQNTMDGYKNLGFNLGWQNGSDPTGTATGFGNTSNSSEFGLVVDGKVAYLEFRIAYKGLTEGDFVSFSIDNNDSSSWSNLWNGTDYATFKLSDEHICNPKAEWIVDKAATCTTAGSQSQYCTYCGDLVTSQEIPATGHKYDDGEVTTAATCTVAGVMTYTCLNNCGDTYTEAIDATGHSFGETENYVKTCTACVYESNMRVAAAALKLESDLTVLLKVRKDTFADSGCENPYVVIDDETKLEPSTEDNTFYVFEYEGIAPHNVGEYFTVVVGGTDATSGEIVEGVEVLEFSVAYTYIKGMIENESLVDDDLKTLLADLLVYCAEAQKCANSSNELETEVISEELLKQYKTDGNRTLNDSLNSDWNVVENATAKIEKAGLILNNKIEMSFKFTTEEDVENLSVVLKDASGNELATVNNFELVENMYMARFDCLTAGQLSELVYVTVVNANGNAISNTVQYSIESYAVNCPDEVKALCYAMMNYGDSVVNYFGN